MKYTSPALERIAGFLVGAPSGSHGHACLHMLFNRALDRLLEGTTSCPQQTDFALHPAARCLQVGGASLKGPSFIKICNSEHTHS